MNKSDNDFTATSSSAEQDAQRSGHERLKTAIMHAKNAQADRLDSITDIKEADIARLELLLQDLQPVFDAVPPQDEQWDFCLSRAMQSRLWLDASAFVMIARDGRSYRFVRDTRLGRIVLAESVDIKVISAAVTRYIAMRMIERERLMDELPSDAAKKPVALECEKNVDPLPDARDTAPDGQLLSRIIWFIIGALIGGVLLVMMFRHYGIILPE